MKRLTFNITAILFSITFTVNTFGQTYPAPFKIHSPDGNQEKFFGRDLDVSGDTAIINAPYGINSNEEGSVYIFVRYSTGWAQQKRITDPNGSSYNSFGQKVAISGDTAVITDNLNAYIYVRNGANWSLQTTLTDTFGFSFLAIENDTLALSNDRNLFVYVRNGTTWSIQAVKASATGQFIGEVDLSGDTLVAGDLSEASSGGTAYVFVRSGSTWTQQTKLLAPDGSNGDYFGRTVSIDGDTVIVGAPFDTVGSNIRQGTAYIFTRTGSVWSFQQSINAYDGESQDRFGYAVKVLGDSIFIGATSGVGSFPNQGAVYNFSRNGLTWTLSRKIIAPDATANSGSFGNSLDVSGDSLLVGTPGDSYPIGSTYVFSLTPETTNCNYQISPSSANFANSGENSSFDVTTTSGCLWTAISNDSWITTTSTGTGTGIVDFSIGTNSTGQSRTGTISIGGQIFTVNQSGDITIDGSNITNINASNITTGTLDDNRLSSNVATLSGNQTFTGAKTFNGGIFGNGSGLTNIDAASITTGTLDSSRLGLIPTANIADNAITSSKIANNQVVRSLNGLTDNINLIAGNNITITPSGNDLTFSSVVNSGNFIQNSLTQQSNSNFNISGNGKAGGELSGNVISATTQYNLGGARILISDPSNLNLFVGTSGYSNTTGSHNSFFGTISGNYNTTGSYNSFSGVASGYSNTTGERNAFFGVRTGYSNTTGSANSFFGFQSGMNNTNSTGNTFMGVNSGTLNTTGNYNSFFGLNSGLNNTIGIANSFYGVNSGFSNTTGNSNTFIGFQSGFGNTTGLYNTFLGQDSGKSNTEGSLNTFLGFDSGKKNISGDWNTFVGAYAGQTNTTGFHNTFLGINAGGGNTTGYYNSFIGVNSGILNTTGYFNSFTGMYSGYQNTSGYYNSFFGFQSGYTNTTGNNNTIIGTYANVGSNNLTFATAIGAYSTVNTSNTIALGRTNGSDKVVIYGLGGGGFTQLCRNSANQISNCSSSLRYKTNIKPFNFGLQVVNQLQPITFNWKGNGLLDLGFGAEELAKINPLLVNYNEKGEVEGVKYNRISTVLVNAVKEQQSEIEKLKKQVNEQQTVIIEMKKLLCQQNPNAEMCK